MQAVIQILKVNELRSGTKDGRQWEMQDAECLLMSEQGEVDQVGVLQLSRVLREKGEIKPGTYTGTFALVAGMRDRRINAVLTGLVPTRAQPAPK